MGSMGCAELLLSGLWVSLYDLMFMGSEDKKECRESLVRSRSVQYPKTRWVSIGVN
jgi:hypothetical protein